MNEPLPAPENVASGGALPDFRGLSSSEAAARLARDGPNLLPQPEQRAWWAIILNILREPMLLLLVSATAVYLLLGDPGEAAVLGASVVIVIALTAYQEQKSERALQALRELSSPRARVLRDGEPRLLAGRDVVVGDVILVAEGDRVPADARVLEESDLHVDESMLTGESVPVRCAVASGEDGRGLLHASTLVVRGRGSAEVVAIGARTSVGRIGAQLGRMHSDPTPLQREIRRVVALFAILSVASCLLMTGLYVATRGGWLEGLLAGITLAMSNLPEEFPVVLTVFLALGAWRMAQHKALVRRASAIEALGAITVLCTDKTGTLTENRMAVAELVPDGGGDDPAKGDSHAEQGLLESAVLASQPRSHDPMERALQDAASRSVELQAAVARNRHVREYPLSADCPAVAHAWSQPGRDGFVVACKGAPETVAELCGLEAERRAAVLAVVDSMARRGLRVLAAASWTGGAEVDESGLPGSIRDFRFRWLGLVGFADPLRAGVADAVVEAHAAGIRLIMLTGDHLETARAIALQAGLAAQSEVALGRELDELDERALAARVSAINVFARVRPEHKLRLVNALKDSGEVVAMTGDGVNDAPALMAAHVGVAMGGRGTDVAREASSIVLLDDNFVTVVHAIRQGRGIYDNILRAVRYILAVHVPITGLALLPMFSGGPLVLLPLHVVFLELIIDPACSIVFEREPAADDIMRRPPRPPRQPLLGLRGLLTSLGHGACMFAVVVVVYALGVFIQLPAAELGALAFTALVAGNLGLIVLYRAGASPLASLLQRNLAFWIVSVSALSVLALITRFEVPAAWFGFVPPPIDAWLLALLLPPLTTILLAATRSRRS